MKAIHSPVNRLLREAIGRRIAAKRETLLYSQRELMKRAQAGSQRHLWGIEKGRDGLSIDMLKRLAFGLGVTMAELVADIEADLNCRGTPEGEHQGYWIQHPHTFRCYHCGHQYDRRTMSFPTPVKRIERWNGSR